MIQATELRIGNKIQRRSNGAICTVNWGIIKDMDLGNELNVYEGIPLSPEILEKCGFEKREHNFYEKYQISYNKKTFSLIKRKNNFLHLDADGNVKYIPLYNLHQLQNLYYALTGKELIFNI